jgi:hypothetical protein
MYVALPHMKGNVTYVDVRAIPFVAIFALLFALAVAEERSTPSRTVALLSVALACANLAVLAVHLRPANRVMAQARELAKSIPPRSLVLPVMSGPVDGRTEPYDGFGLFATIEVGAITPYMFQGGAQAYFRLRATPPAPSEFWYAHGADPGDGAVLSSTFDQVFAMAPFDRERLPFATREVARNDAAVLLEVVSAPSTHAPGAATP